MTTRKLLAIALAAASLYSVPAAARTDFGIVLNFGPPPVRYEPAPAYRPGYVWVSGYWDWRYHRHVWVPGHHVRARPGYAYRSGHWDRHGAQWSYSRPGWERYADRDRDGIRDPYDRYPRDPRRG